MFSIENIYKKLLFITVTLIKVFPTRVPHTLAGNLLIPPPEKSPPVDSQPPPNFYQLPQQRFIPTTK